MRIRILFVASAATCLSALLPDEPAFAQSAAVAIRNVTVVDVTDGSLHPRRTVLVEGGRIQAISDVGELELRGAEIVEGGGYLIPGLWDMHAHGARESRVESFFRLFLANGVTGIRDPGLGSRDVAATARATVRNGELPGPPRIVAVGNMVDGPPGLVRGVQIASTPQDGRRLVDSLHAAGAPFIKVYFLLSPRTYLAIAERSAERGIPFVGHVPFRVSAADAAGAGQRSIEHLTGVLLGCSSDEETLLIETRRGWQERVRGPLEARNVSPFSQLLAGVTRRALVTQDDDRCRNLAEQFIRNQTWQVPTLVSLRGKAYLRELAAADDPRRRYFTPPGRWVGESPFGESPSEDEWELWQAAYEREKAILGMMAALGVPILAGTDTATPWAFPGFGLHDELELLVEAGLTPLRAIQAATLNPARFFGRTDELGTVEEGKLADLVLLDGNPLEDITNTQRIRAVVAGGRLYRRADLDRLLAEVEAMHRDSERQESSGPSESAFAAQGVVPRAGPYDNRLPAGMLRDAVLEEELEGRCTRSPAGPTVRGPGSTGHAVVAIDRCLDGSGRAAGRAIVVGRAAAISRRGARSWSFPTPGRGRAAGCGRIITHTVSFMSFGRLDHESHERNRSGSTRVDPRRRGRLRPDGITNERRALRARPPVRGGVQRG